MDQHWSSTEHTSKQYTCAYCDRAVASSAGYHAMERRYGTGIESTIQICPNCANPTYFQGHNRQIPRPSFGSAVPHINDALVEAIYAQARDCTAYHAYTAAVMLCRKLLMHIAVQHGAPENQSFLTYVTFLDSKGYIPPNGKKWVDAIRQKGNTANHEIQLMSDVDARNSVRFTEMLLRFIYELPNLYEEEKKP